MWDTAINDFSVLNKRLAGERRYPEPCLKPKTLDPDVRQGGGYIVAREAFIPPVHP